VTPYSFHPKAEAELSEAAAHYESQVTGLGRAFAAEAERIISLLRTHPDTGSSLGLRRRRMSMDRFPYWIVYQRDPESLLIIAVAHFRRRPGYWRRRK
jgi:plasmid stabilization system protein ParE